MAVSLTQNKETRPLDKGGEKSNRPRDAAATRKAILEAALTLFTERGYDRATVREIAAMANINQALVMRYFGSKEGLFAAVFAEREDMRVKDLMSGPIETLGERLVDEFISYLNSGNQFRTLLKSLNNPSVGPLLRDATIHSFATPLSAIMAGADADKRAALITSELLSFGLFRELLMLGGEFHLDEATLARYTADNIQRLISQ